MAETLKGRCFCGAVEFELSGEPAAAAYCHCGDCASWAGAPVNAFTMYPAAAVKVVKGEAELATYAKTERSQRKFCRRCGGHVMVDHPAFGMVEVFPALVEGLQHQPALHIRYAEKTVAMQDGLPKFKDLPADFGGSGELLAE